MTRSARVPAAFLPEPATPYRRTATSGVRRREIGRAAPPGAIKRERLATARVEHIHWAMSAEPTLACPCITVPGGGNRGLVAASPHSRHQPPSAHLTDRRPYQSLAYSPYRAPHGSATHQGPHRALRLAGRDLRRAPSPTRAISLGRLRYFASTSDGTSISRLRILPVGPLGSSSRNQIVRGYL